MKTLEQTKTEQIVKIQYNGAYATLIDAPYPVVSRIRTALTYTDDSKSYINRFVAKGNYQIDDEVCLLQGNKFLTGLVPRVSYVITNMGYKVSYQCKNTAIPVMSIELPDWLYEHQHLIISKALDTKKCVIQSPTGSGKTYSSAFYAQHFPTARILMTVPEVNLLEQNAKVLEEIISEPVGRMYSKKKIWGRITVGTINTLANLVDEFPDIFSKFDVLIIDECHRCGSGKLYNKVVAACKNVEYKLGLSATAWREKGDDLVLEGLIGPTVLRIKEQDLVNLGTIVKPRYYSIPVNSGVRQYQQYNKTTKSYNTSNGKPARSEVYQECIVRNDERNNMIVQIVDQYLKNQQYKDYPCLILVDTIEHGEIVRQLLENAGINAPYVHGKSKAKERVQIVDDLRNNKVRCVIGSRIFNEGTDIPILGLGIIAGGGSAESRIVQQVGRFLRTAERKTDCIVVDFMDSDTYYLKSNFMSRKKSITSRYKDCHQQLELEQLIKLLT